MKLTKITIATIALILTLTFGSIIAFLPAAYTSYSYNQTTIPDDMLQYECAPWWADAARTYCNPGPAPSTTNIKWKTRIPGISGVMSSLNGMVFVKALGVVYALDGGTGNIIWSERLAGGPGGAVKISDDIMVFGNKGIRISDGSVVWERPPGFSCGTYIPELEMCVDAGNYGWSLTDPSQPPIPVWNRTSENVYAGLAVKAYGDGKLFLASRDNFLVCADALTGETLWTVPTTSDMGYSGSYVDGKFVHGGLDNNMHAWDADTGELLWTYNPGTWYGMWSAASGAAYGMVYEKNQDTYLYAINASTGELVWRTKGPGAGYSNWLIIGGGKVYNCMGDPQYRDFLTGEYSHSEYNCYDAYTGELIWSLPLDVAQDTNPHIAYGNLYVIPRASRSLEIGEKWTYAPPQAVIFDEIWCISDEPADWSMYHCDPEHSADGTGPTNLAFKWNFKADAPIKASPTLVDGVAYFGSMLGTIYAVDANTGGELWTFKTDFCVKSSIAVVNGKLYTGADDGNIYCLDAATGTKLWETFAGGFKKGSIGGMISASVDSARSSPMVLMSRVYVGALDSNLYCLDALTGDVIWKFQTGGPIQATPTIVNNEIYISSSTPGNGTIYKLDLNGNVILQKEVPYGIATTNDQKSMLTSPTVIEDKVFVRTGSRANYALNATTGEIIWTYDGRWGEGNIQSGGITQHMPMLYKYGRLYFNDFYGITCLNSSDGTEIWHKWMSRENMAQGLSYSCLKIYAVTDLGVLYVLDAISGEKLSYYEFAPTRCQLHSMPVPYNGSLYLGADDWHMYCFEEAPPPEPWTPPLEPTYPTAEEIAQKVLDELPTNPSANDIAKAILNQLPSYPEGPTAEEVAQKVLDNLPEGPSAEDVAKETINRLPAYPEPAEIPEAPAYTTMDLTILTAVVIAIVIGTVSVYMLRKRK